MVTCRCWWQFGDDGFQAHAGNVSQLLFIGHHVGTKRVHHRLHLTFLYLSHQRTKTTQTSNNHQSQTIRQKKRCFSV